MVSVLLALFLIYFFGRIIYAFLKGVVVVCAYHIGNWIEEKSQDNSSEETQEILNNLGYGQPAQPAQNPRNIAVEEKIQKLMNLANSTTNIHEANLARKRAQELRQSLAK